MVTKQITGSMSRWGLACTLAGTLASVPPSALAARPILIPAATFEEIPDVELEVRISPEIVEAVELQQWVNEEGRRVLDELPNESTRRGSLRVEIGGALYNYQVTITVLRDGEDTGTTNTWLCECSNEELLEKLRAALPELARELEIVQVNEPEPVPVITPPVPPVVDLKHKQLGSSGAAGVALMTVGVSGMGAGVALMVLGARPLAVSARSLGNTADRDLMTSGKLAAIGGSGVLLTGALLYFLRKRIDRGDRRLGMLVPAIDPHGRAHVTITGRF